MYVFIFKNLLANINIPIPFGFRSAGSIHADVFSVGRDSYFGAQNFLTVRRPVALMVMRRWIPAIGASIWARSIGDNYDYNDYCV